MWRGDMGAASRTLLDRENIMIRIPNSGVIFTAAALVSLAQPAPAQPSPRAPAATPTWRDCTSGPSSAPGSPVAGSPTDGDAGDMGKVKVSWIGGVWFLEHDGAAQPFVDGDWLDVWLAQRDLSRDDLMFSTHSLRERFVHDFGPIAVPGR